MGPGKARSRWHSIGDSWNPRRALPGPLYWAVAADVTLECPGACLHGPADPHGERSRVERRPSGERAHALSRKVHTLEGKLAAALRVCVPRRLGSAAIIELALQDPEPEVVGGSGEAQAFLDAGLVVYILPATSFHRDETNPAPTKLC